MKYDNLYMKGKQKKKYVYYSNKKYFLERDLGVKIVENGTILPAKQDLNAKPKLWAIGGVVDSNDNFITESCSRYLFGGYYEHNEAYDDYIDEEVVFLGPFVSHWGHFICDQISRLWYIVDNPKKYKIAYCGWNWGQGLTDISGNYLELLEKIGVSSDQLINVQKPTRFKKIIIPEFSFIPEKYCSKAFSRIVDTIVKNNDFKLSRCPSKIYFTRSLLSNNDKEKGEDRIVTYLKKIGYKILSPEKLSVAEQIYYLNNAKDICMISGSISHNIMFCRNTNTNIIILNKTDMINGYQMVIDHMCPSKITYIDVYIKLRKVLFGMGPFLIYVSNYMQLWGKQKNSDRIRFSDYIWYFKKYHSIYSNSKNKAILKDQNKSFKNKKKGV